MINLSIEEIARALGARIANRGEAGAPQRAEIDSRKVGRGDLFFGLPGSSGNGSAYAFDAAQKGAWGVVVDARGPVVGDLPPDLWVFESEDPLGALQGLASAWRNALGSHVVGITGSVGKTTTKDITRGLLGERAHAGRENFNTEIGLPLTILEAAPGTEYLVLEMAMRGAGQIAELASIARPDTALITNVGPVHTELLGSIEAVASAKAELLDGVSPGSFAIVPAEAGPLEPEVQKHLGRLEVRRFGAGGHVWADEVAPSADGVRALVRLDPSLAEIAGGPDRAQFEFPFRGRHNLLNALGGIAAGAAAGGSIESMAENAHRIAFSSFRSEYIQLRDNITVINDCYNANPVSMAAAIEHLAEEAGDRRIAVLGLMAELGPDSVDYHRDVGELARRVDLDLVIGVGVEARDYGPDIGVDTAREAADVLSRELRRGDVVLVKGSRAAGLEEVAERLMNAWGVADG